MKTRAQLRSSFAAQCVAVPNWVESRFAADVFGRDPDSLMGTATVRLFAVGLGDTNNRMGGAGNGYRGRAGQGLLVETAVIVRWAVRLRPKDQQASRDEAEAAGQELVNACEAYTATWPGELKVQLQTITTEVVPSGEWFLGTATFLVLHALPIS